MLTATEQATVSRSGRGGRLPALLLLPLGLYAYPALAGLLGRSEYPLILGRYSTSFFLFNLWSVALAVLVVGAWVKGRIGVLQWSYLLLAATTVVVPANNQLLELAGILVWLPLIRLGSGLGVLVAGFWGHRRGERLRGAAMALSALLVVLSLLDLVLLAVLSQAPQHRQLDRGFREVPPLAGLTAEDLVLVGDSFVWGQGVEVEERMGRRLELRLGPPVRVFSLGGLGHALNQYAGSLEQLPPGVRARHVIVMFYLNDMPAPETLREKVQNASLALGRGFPTLRLVGDMGAKLLVRDVEAYHRYVVESFRTDHPSHAERRDLLREQLERLYALAHERSAEPPLLAILPLMVDYDGYPLDEAHRDLERLAGEAGFRTLDLLPLFRERLEDGTRFRVSPGDNHFDAGTHDLVAAALAEWLSAERGVTAP